MNGVPVDVLVVTWESAADLPACIESLARLAPRPAALVVVDCASSDGSAPLAERLARERLPQIPVRVEALETNLGFAGGMNRALALSTAPYALSLNADAAPAPDFLAPLVARLDADPHAGAATGRLVRPVAADGARRLDACGMRLLRSWRHLDRGSDEPADGRYGAAATVFGGTGAATLYRRAALDDVALEGRVFDERYHSYREDAELAFRLAGRAWTTVYEPAAVAEHRRRVTPSRRADLPAAINYHSLKNRYLLRLDHQSGANFWRTLPWTLPRDLGALGYTLLFERSSLPAWSWLLRHRRELLAHRRALRARITTPEAVEGWFRRDEIPC